jgi:hypothetical protein
MNRIRSFFFVCTLLSFLFTAPAREQGIRKPRTPNCGTWDLVYSPSPNGNGILAAVARVPGTAELWSVGNYNANFHQLTLIEHWDGNSWQVVASPNHASANHYLYGVVAVAPDDVWAVGRYEPDSGGSPTLILHWDGTSWSIVSSPNPATYNGMYAVAAASATDVWAVGYYYAGQQRTLVEHWDGASWSIVPSPNVGSSANLLAAITVVPNNQANLWAVGYYYRGDGNPSTLVQRWDGTAWSVVPSPDGSTRENYLVGVSSTGLNDAWAVGYYNTPNGLYLSLTEHWDGSSWQVVPSPSLSSSLTALTAVSTISATDVWAVGTYYGTGAQLTLAQHWDGNSWQVFDTPNPAGETDNAINEFNSVASVPGVGVWAVGDYEIIMPAKPPQTLTAFYCPVGTQSPTPTPSPTATATSTATSTPTPTATATPTATTTATATPAASPTTTPTPTASVTATPTITPPPSPTPRSSPSPRPRPSPPPRPNS